MLHEIQQAWTEQMEKLMKLLLCSEFDAKSCLKQQIVPNSGSFCLKKGYNAKR